MRGLLRALVLLALLVAPLAMAAYPEPGAAFQQFQSPCLERYDRRFVYDFLGWLDPALGREVEGAACEVYEATGAHYVLVLVNDTAGESIEGYAVHLFERWGIGDKDRLDGAMLLYVHRIDEQGAAVRVEVGYGLEPVLTGHISAEAVRLIREAKQRSLAAGDGETGAVSLALGAGSLYLLQTIMDHHEGVVPKAAARIPEWFWFLAFVLLVLAVQVLAASARRSGGGWGYRSGSGGWSSGYPGRWGGGGFGGGGGGWGGGGSFGGGRSGGGGGSGRI